MRPVGEKLIDTSLAGEYTTDTNLAGEYVTDTSPVGEKRARTTVILAHTAERRRRARETAGNGS